MQPHQFDVTPFSSAPVEAPREVPVGFESVDLLRQILEIEREQLSLARAAAAAHDAGARWRAFLSRWRQDFPEISDSCREALMVLEKTYAALMAELVQQLREDGTSALETDFALQEFLDKYGMKLTQLGTILNLVAPLAEASAQGESS
jgi:hypothetical protein